jgi:hypothetical protein
MDELISNLKEIREMCTKVMYIKFSNFGRLQKKKIGSAHPSLQE